MAHLLVVVGGTDAGRLHGPPMEASARAGRMLDTEVHARGLRATTMIEKRNDDQATATVEPPGIDDGDPPPARPSSGRLGTGIPSRRRTVSHSRSGRPEA
jgi:hypothetical protein